MKIVDNGKTRFVETSERAVTWVTARQDDDGLVGFATQLYGRDRDAFASVLGSALALRLFLFVVPANVSVLGIAALFHLNGIFSGALESSVVTGEMAASYRNLSTSHALWIALSGLTLTLWAGRSLTRVMATCATAAWQLDSRRAKVSVRGVAALTGMIFALMLASVMFARMRDIGGIPVSLAAWIAVAASMMLGWFFVQLALPRGTDDPAAVLPGAALMGVSFAVLQWFMQIYLPGKIERSADTMGNLAATVASLGYFFFIGRLMATSFVVNAIVFARWGSITHVVFGLPGLRRIPARFPSVPKFFGLDSTEPVGQADSVVPEADASSSGVG
jgi:hypothetical protein